MQILKLCHLRVGILFALHERGLTHEGWSKGVKRVSHLNVISMDKKRKLKKLKEKESIFKSYLSKLKQEELQYEADYVMNRVHESDLSEEFLLKSALIMDELAKRVDANKMSNTISQYSSNIRSKITTLFNQ